MTQENFDKGLTYEAYKRCSKDRFVIVRTTGLQMK